MPLPLPTVPRTLTHTRKVRFEGYRRADGRWDIEGHLLDVKPADYPLSSGTRPAGVPVHEMWLRLTITPDLEIVEAAAQTDAMPYPPFCAEATPDYRRLVGLNLGHGFRKAVRQRFHDVAGCRHLNELLTHFPTAAIQTLAGEVIDNEDRGAKPFQLDRCRALDTRGEAVRRYYPKWHRGAKLGTG